MAETGYELVWGPAGGVESPASERAPVAGAEDLDARLDALTAEAEAGEPLVAELEHPVHGTLGIGLGAAHSVAYLHRADGEPPYLLSAGDGEPGGEELVFFHDGVWTEFPPEAAIEPAAARRAMHEFLDRGERPASVRWTET